MNEQGQSIIAFAPRASLYHLRRIMQLALVIALTAGGGLAFATSADALNTHLFLDPPGRVQVPSTGSQHQLGAIAINQSTHHIYVLNLGNPGEMRVWNFRPEGKLDPTNPFLATPASAELFAVAIDNSGGAHNGDFYVLDRRLADPSGRLIQQYGPNGVATGVSISESSIPPNGTPQAGGLPPVVNTGAFKPKVLAVGPTGNLLVADNETASGLGSPGGAKAIDEFSPDGTFVAQRAVGRIGVFVEGLDVDSAGNIYVAVSAQSPLEPETLTSGLHQLDAAGECLQSSCAPIDPERAFGVAVDRSSGTILVTQNDEGNDRPRFSEFDSSGALLGTSGEGVLRNVESTASKIAIDEGSGIVAVGDPPGAFDLFGPVVILPDVTVKAATVVTASNATLNGEINAAGGSSATCTFEYAAEASFKSNGFSGAQSVPCVPGGPFVGESSVPVHADLIGLNGGTTYHFRLVGTNSIGSNPSGALEFTTEGPSVRSQTFSSILETGATLESVINPRGADTAYRFQYVDQASYEADRALGPGHDGFASALEMPIGGADLGAGSGDVPVSQAIGNLAPGTSYHFRVVAANANGQAVGPDSRFQTFPPTVTLPDGRGYEQASPVDKQGANVQGEPNAVQAAADGNAITFTANAGFPGALGAQEFGNFQASRASDASGWKTEGLLPTAQSGPFGKVLGWNEDLTETYVSNKTPTTPPSIYLRGAGGGLTEIASGGKERYPFAYAGSTSDGSAVLFESRSSSLAPGAASGLPNAYIWDKATGEVRLAGVLSNTTGKAPPKGSFAGPYDWFKGAPKLERGGAAGFYYTAADHAISRDGTRVFFTASGTGQVYVRLNPLQEQSPVSGGVCSDPALACTVRISAPIEGLPDTGEPAAFVGATPDGNTAFFLDKAKLTNSAAPNGGYDLYRYDVPTGNLTDLTSDPADTNGAEVQGLIGMSGDGKYVYYVANGRSLAPGAAQGTCRGPFGLEGECNIYLVHSGQTQLIARLAATPARNPQESDERNWVPGALLSEGANEPSEITSRVSADGQVLLFRSVNELTPYDNRGIREMYRFQIGAGLTCISCSPTNLPPSGPAGVQDIARPAVGPKLESSVITRNLVLNGNRIFFDTPDRLVSNDVNGVNDVYEWEANGTGSCTSAAQNGGCLYLISSGTSPLPSYFGDASSNGDDAFFFTAQSLVRQDRDELVDVYDARKGGGIPSQNASPPTPCSGEECPAAAGASPATQAPGSTAVQGGNVKPIKCKKGFKPVTKHGKERCVKKPKKSKRAKNRKHGGKKQKHHAKGHKKGGHR